MGGYLRIYFFIDLFDFKRILNEAKDMTSKISKTDNEAIADFELQEEFELAIESNDIEK